MCEDIQCGGGNQEYEYGEGDPCPGVGRCRCHDAVVHGGEESGVVFGLVLNAGVDKFKILACVGDGEIRCRDCTRVLNLVRRWRCSADRALSPRGNSLYCMPSRPAR